MTALGTNVMMMLTAMASRMWRWLCWAGGHGEVALGGLLLLAQF